MQSAERPGSPRAVRSFVRREGRMTAAQTRAIDSHWRTYGIDAPDAPLVFPQVFGREASVVLEIGFGNGEHLLARAAAEPDLDFIGVEVHRPGVGRVLQRAAASEMSNLRVVCDDAVEVVRDWFQPSSLTQVQILFPDPWPKKRHHKRRLIQAPFCSLLASRLRRGGCLQLATDWEPYAQHMLEVLNAEPLLQNAATGSAFMERPGRPVTKFEARGSRLGHAVFDLEYIRVDT